MSVYDVAQLGERFDLVIFMGVLYHLRSPLAALDAIRSVMKSGAQIVASRTGSKRLRDLAL